MEEKIRIFVLDRGFVLVGYSEDPTRFALWLPLRNARCIRLWGTTQGVAELIEGPTDKTVLDATAPIETIPVRAILRILDAKESKWAKYLK